MKCLFCDRSVELGLAVCVECYDRVVELVRDGCVHALPARTPVDRLLDFIFLGERPASKAARCVLIAIPAIGMFYALGHPV